MVRQRNDTVSHFFLCAPHAGLDLTFVIFYFPLLVVGCGMSLTAPPWYKSRKGGRIGSGIEKEANDDIPLPPPAHLTVQNIVYEVDVPILEEGETTPENEHGDSSPKNGNALGLVEDESPGMPITARQYGQVGNSARQEWMIKRRLGEDALGHSVNSSRGSSIRTELRPPGPGRLRLLSGITASFETRTMTALMGSSGAFGVGSTSSFRTCTW